LIALPSTGMPIVMEYRPSCSFGDQGTNHISNVFMDDELSSSSEEERVAAFSLHPLKCSSAHRFAAVIGGIVAISCLAYATLSNDGQRNMLKESPISMAQIKRDQLHDAHENLIAAGNIQETHPDVLDSDSLPASKPVSRLVSLKQTVDGIIAPQSTTKELQATDQLHDFHVQATSEGGETGNSNDDGKDRDGH